MADSHDPVDAQRTRHRVKQAIFGSAPEVRIGRYVVSHKLGEGGMGVVYAARDPDLDRNVALKLLQLGSGSSLLAEAKAAARVRHPNLVAVYDVGEHDGHVFITMEFVDGGTWTDWLVKPRSLNDVLDTIEQTGLALAALHDAGLVHRDFKPDNVMVDAAGVARVGDFGLACQADDTHGALPGEQLAITASKAGTPAYMAPEVIKAAPADTRSDQFSFCVSAYEAVYGERPFAGETVAELADNVLRGRVRDVPKTRARPAWLHRLLLRGLSVAPEDRFASMTELVRELSKGRGKRRRHLATLAGVALLLCVVGTTLVLGGAGQSKLCTGAQTALGVSWNQDVRHRVRASFSGTNVGYAASTFARVDSTLNQYIGDWKKAHTATCEATRERGEVSERIMDLRMACLGRRKHQVDALVAVFIDANKDVVQKAAAATSMLVPIKTCAQIQSAKMAIPTPEEPAMRRAVEQIRRDLAVSKAQWLAGRYAKSAAQAESLLLAAKKLAFRPLLAEIYFRRAQALEDAGQPDAELTAEAVFVAEAVGYDAMTAQALLLQLIQLSDIGDAAVVAELVRRSDAATQRLNNRSGRARFLYLQGTVLGGKAELPATLEAIKVLQDGGNDPVLLVALHGGLVASYRGLGQFKEAVTVGEEALRLSLQTHGPDHPATAHPHHELAISHWQLGESKLARQHIEAAIRIRTQSLGIEHQGVVSARTMLVNLVFQEGKLEEAARLQEQNVVALRKLVEREGKRGHRGLAEGLSNLGVFRTALGDFAAANEHQTEALAIYTKLLGPNDRHVALVHSNMADLAIVQADWYEARKHARIALTVWEATIGPDHVWISYAQIALGVAELRLGRVPLATQLIERGLAVRTKLGAPQSSIAVAQTWLGQARWESGKQKQRARQLVVDAVNNLGPDEVALRKQAKAWLAEHKR